MCRCFNGIVICLLLLSSYGRCQDLNFRSLSFKEGLKSYNVLKTLQDNYGFIWIATQDGIYRFDGKNFDVIKNKANSDTTTIGNAFLDAVFGADGNLYVADWKYGIDVINPKTFEIKQFTSGKSNVNPRNISEFGIEKLSIDGNQRVWFGGAGFLGILDQKSSQYNLLNHKIQADSSFNITFIQKISDHLMLVGLANKGMILINSKTAESKKILLSPNRNVPKTIRDITFFKDTLYALSDRSVVVGKIEHGSWRYIKEVELNIVKDGTTTCLVHDNSNSLWIGSNLGLISLNLITHQIQKQVSDNQNPGSIQDKNITHLLIDNQNNLWVSTSKMLQVASLNKPFLTAYNGSKQGSDKMEHLYSLRKLDSTQLFATGTDGIYRINLLSQKTHRIKKSTSLGIIHHLEKIDEDFWIVSTDEGMFGYRPSKELISKSLLLNRYKEWERFQNNYFNTALRKHNIIYFASEENEGLIKWDMNNHEITQFKLGVYRAGGIPENHIRNLKSDQDNKIWSLSDNTASQFDPATDSVVRILRFSSTDPGLLSKVYSDMYDDGQTLWFCTYGGGINGLSKSKNNWTYITEKEGLSNNCVYSILPENDSILWVSTNQGLSRVNKLSKTISNYFLEDGLQDNSFDEQGSLKVNNKMFFAGINGLTAIDLDSYQNREFNFNAFISKVEYFTDGEKTTVYNLTWDKLKLPPETSPILIHLSALNFMAAHKIRFSYKIEDYYDHYQDVQNSNVITLNTLPHGNYKITIVVSNENGTYLSKTINLELIIEPKWHQTWLFKLGLLLIGVSVIYGLYYLRISRLKSEQKIRLKLARDLHDDLGSTISSIGIYANLALVDQREAYLTMLMDTTKHASVNLRDMIWVLDDKTGNFEQLINRFENFAIPFCLAHNIKFTITISKDAKSYELNSDERKNLYMILKESTNNSAKYSKCEHIEITVSLVSSKPCIQIKDDGSGFDEKTIIAGNGLRNLRARALDINYRINIVSNSGNGTMIELQKRKF